MSAEISITNEQKSVRIPVKRITALIRFLFSKEKVKGQGVSVLFCDDKKIKSLHKQYMNLNTPTDVMAFPGDDDFCPGAEGYLGDVVVSAERAKAVASTYREPVIRETERYVVHGILHLLGYDDKAEKKKKIMIARQETILSEFWDSAI
ncbi:MAG: rRNA maturation RNase YbeY [Candidatus Omnitrophica bacterium]|nr:rRNA maturation RNase YbeY [Candidatus Omnitrophota bacterium]